ncbi:hypothetical protein B0H19DRAFT_1114751 [Mycena capillaripes]|nr:hypothetical protein B0H19DRAFT_1114751 [Mycena capillaripes]
MIPYRKRFCTTRCLVPFLFAFYIFLSIPQRGTAGQRADQGVPDLDFSNLVLELGNGPSVEAGSLTAVFPVTLTSLPTLRNTLSSLASPVSCASKVLVVCPEVLLSQARTAIRQAVRSVPAGSDNHPDISLYPWPSEPAASVLYAAATQVSTKWLLLLDDTGFSGLSNRALGTLLCPVAADLPIGPRGVIGSPGNWSCAPPSPETRPASYLLPPFVLPGSLVREIHEDWSDLGQAISQSRKDRLGGVVRGFGDPDSNWCQDPPFRASTHAGQHDTIPFPQDAFSMDSYPDGLFVFLLPNFNDLHLISQLVCRLHKSGYSIKILLYSESHTASGMREAYSSCHLQYNTMRNTERNVYPMIHDWLDRLEREVDIIFTVREPATQPVRSDHAKIVRIPRDDLMHVDWMGSLSLTEWKNWHVPQVEVSIITQNRPRSLERLLSSLSRGRFFGDSVNLRVNMEQSSDLETVRVVGAYQWSHGSVFVHRRVVHGGLLPAVVESWYPHSNDSYGLLLEDDVELSPLFYAWIKMGILRYRYSDDRRETARLFGISLYQQKNIELHPEGRKAFDARKLFAKNGVPDPSTPYLSQIPCSWGAVYFPEHWREFHAYLAARLSEMTMEIERIVVPDVRSNHWTKSWKKYFIEMVYLQGYVMLYPNYAGFMSLSTNHLEVGSHVKDRPKEKQEMFRLPLMQLGASVQLLELPGGRLPQWDALPVLNLTGFISSLESILLEKVDAA